MTVIESEAKLVLGMDCKLGVKKTFKLNIEDSNPIAASYSKEESAHRLIVRPKLMEDCVANFAANVTEVAVKFGRLDVHMKSTEEGIEETSHDPTKKTLLTELTLNVKDFEKYELDPGADSFELIFSLRDTRPVLQFCELVNVPVQMYMTGPGQPLVLSGKMYNLFEGDFVLATLQGSTNHSTQSSQASTNRGPTPAHGYDRHVAAQHAHGHHGGSLPGSQSSTMSSHPMPHGYQRNVHNGMQQHNPSDLSQISVAHFGGGPAGGQFGAPVPDSQQHHRASPHHMESSQQSSHSMSASSYYRAPSGLNLPPQAASLPSQHSFEQSLPSQAMQIDAATTKSAIPALGVTGVGLWSADIVRSNNRMDEDDDDEAVNSDED